MENLENKSGKHAPEHSVIDIAESPELYNERLKERMEEKRDAKIINWEELVNIAPDMAIWLKWIVRYGNVDSQVLIYWNLNKRSNITEDDEEKLRFTCVFYTDTHKYSISGYQPTVMNPDGYLGCVASTRKPRAGEDWNRGNDLPDGKYCEKTFNNIVRGILAYELKSLQLWRK